MTDPAPLTPAEHMRIFDRLPKAVRRALTNAPFNYDVRDIRKIWKERRRLGYTAKNMAEEIIRNAERQAEENAL